MGEGLARCVVDVRLEQHDRMRRGVAGFGRRFADHDLGAVRETVDVAARLRRNRWPLSASAASDRTKMAVERGSLPRSESSSSTIHIGLPQVGTPSGEPTQPVTGWAGCREPSSRCRFRPRSTTRSHCRHRAPRGPPWCPRCRRSCRVTRPRGSGPAKGGVCGGDPRLLRELRTRSSHGGLCVRGGGPPRAGRGCGRGSARRRRLWPRRPPGSPRCRRGAPARQASDHP